MIFKKITKRTLEAEEKFGRELESLKTRGILHSGEAMDARRKPQEWFSRGLVRLASLFGNKDLVSSKIILNLYVYFSDIMPNYVTQNRNRRAT